MARRGNVRVSITGDASGVGRATRDAEGKLHRLNVAGSRSLRGLGTAAKVGGAALVGGLAVGLKGAVDEYREAEKAGRQTEAVIKSTGGAANVSAKDVEALANSLSLKAGIDDEVIQSGENVLLTFRDIRNEAGKGNDIFNQATKVSLDLSVAMGKDLKSSTVAVGKALNDPIKGITALGRVGVQFTEKQKDQIKTLTETGDKMGAQKIILRELNKEFAGSAAAQADPFDKANVAIKNLEESIGTALGPAIEAVANGLAKFVGQLQTGTGAGGKFRDAMVTAFNGVKVGFEAARAAIQTAIQAVNGYLNQHRAEINQGVHALQNFGKAVLWVFQNLLLPVARRVFPALKQMIEGTLRVILGIVRVFTGLFTGDFGKAWQGVKDIFSGALKVILGNLRVLTAPFREAASRLGQGLVKGFNEVGKLPGLIARWYRDALLRVVGFVNNYVNASRRIGSAIINGIVDYIKKLPGRIADVLRTGLKAVGDFANNFFNKAKDVGKSILNGLGTALRDLGKWFYNKGQDAIKSFISGLKDAALTIPNAVGGALGGAFNAIRPKTAPGTGGRAGRTFGPDNANLHTGEGGDIGLFGLLGGGGQRDVQFAQSDVRIGQAGLTATLNDDIKAIDDRMTQIITEIKDVDRKIKHYRTIVANKRARKKVRQRAAQILVRLVQDKAALIDEWNSLNQQIVALEGTPRDANGIPVPEADTSTDTSTDTTSVPDTADTSTTSTDTTTTPDPDTEAQLNQANARLAVQTEKARLAEATLRTFGSSGDIGSGGFANAYAAAQGGPVIVVNTLHPGDPNTLNAIGQAATAGIGYQGAQGSPRATVGV